MISRTVAYTLCLKKCANSFFGSMAVRYKPISIKNGRHVMEETLNKTMHKVPTSPKMCCGITL